MSAARHADVLFVKEKPGGGIISVATDDEDSSGEEDGDEGGDE